MRNLAIVIFDNAEVLDFAGPFEVFAVTRTKNNERLFNVYMVAEHDRPILARNGFSVNPNYTFENCPQPDIVLVPGGRGTRAEMDNPVLLNWLKKHNETAEMMLSVCTGSFLYAKAGFLDGLSATTYHTEFEQLGKIAPTTTLKPGERFVDNGRIITSAGISAGIDMSLYTVAKLHGLEQARNTAKRMEYHWSEFGTENLT